MRKILTLIAALSLVASLAVGGSIAYLQDQDEAVNTMTLGNVYIDQIEQERDANGKLVPFTQAKPLFPAVYEGDQLNMVPADQQPVSSVKDWEVTPFNENVLDKIVTVKNIGKSDAYVRTIIAFETDNATDNTAWNKMHQIVNRNRDTVAQDMLEYAEFNGNGWVILMYTYKAALTPGETSMPSLKQIYMNKEMTNEDVEAVDSNGNGTYDVLVISQAVQTNGFANAAAALNTAFGELNEENVQKWFGDVKIPATVSTADELTAALNAGNDAILTDDLKEIPVDNVAPYSNYYGIALNGNTIDGAGKTMDFEMGELKDGKADNYGIMTSGGTIKNTTVTGVFRGIMIMNPTEDVIIDNVIIGDEDVCYAINTGEGDGTQDLIVKNSTIKGWSSYGTAIKSVSFTDCTFAQGEYYTDVFGRLVKPYVDTVFENCEFNSKFYIDLSQLGKDGNGNVLTPDTKITLKNCTVNGVKLTADNWTSLIVAEDDCGNGQISIEAKDGSYMSTDNVLDYVIIK